MSRVRWMPLVISYALTTSGKVKRKVDLQNPDLSVSHLAKISAILMPFFATAMIILRMLNSSQALLVIWSRSKKWSGFRFLMTCCWKRG